MTLGSRKTGAATVPTFDDFEALERRVRALESRGARDGAEWAPVARSPLGVRKTRRLIAAGKLEASRVGRRLYVRLGDLERLLEERVQAQPKPPELAAVSNETPAEYARRTFHSWAAAGPRKASGSK